MRYSDAYLREFLPAGDPPDGTVPGEVLDEVASWLDRSPASGGEPSDRELVARATRWTYAVFSELGLGRFRLQRFYQVPWNDHPWLDGRMLTWGNPAASFGLFDEDAGARGLGLVVDLPPETGRPFLVVGHVTFPRLKTSFPLALRQSEVELHLAHPQGATSACWAKCNQSQKWGFLTAGHAVSGNRPGRTVPMAGGGSGTLVRSYYQPVDAAFVQGSSPATNPSPLPVLSFPAVGMTVNILCQSGPQNRKVVEVTNNMRVLNTRSIGVYLYLDRPASKGDSGALVTTATGDAVGIYRGQMALPQPAAPCGVAQNFEQAIFALDVTPYL